jgi:MFS family permease
VTDSHGEGDFRYEGWRVAGAASVGVFVSFASLLVYTFGVLLKPLAEEFAWSRELWASLVGRLTTGWLLDRFFAPRVGFCLLSLAAFGTYLLAGASSPTLGVLAAAFIGFGMGAEADATPYILSRYLGLRSFAMLYGLTWTAYAIAGAVGPIPMGRASDATGSYTVLLTQLAIGTFLIAALMLLMPGYERAYARRAPAASSLG